MRIGKPRRIYRVEPLRDPVPSKQLPEKEPKPVRVPSKTSLR